jgi:peroxiredoxin
MKIKILLVVLTVMIVSVFGMYAKSSFAHNNAILTSTNNTVSVSAPTIGAPAPVFSLEDQDGKKVSLSDFAGKIVVLEWTNPDCPFVKRHYEAKTMTTLANKYKDKGVVWLAINSTYYMGKDKYKEWIKANNISYPILDDHDGSIGRIYAAKTTPHMFIIGKDGKLVYQGGIDNDAGGDKDNPVTNYVDQALTELIASKPVSVAQSRPYGCSVKYAKQ